MSRIVLFSSSEAMMEQANQVVEKLNLSNVGIQLVTGSECVEEARKAAAAGAEIIIARGNQASLIRRYTNIPVVEIVLTAQEIGLLVKKAKLILGRENIIIGVVGFENMFCDMRFFDEIFGIKLKGYFVKYTEELETAVSQAAKEGADIIIGGNIAIEVADKFGIPSLFLASSEDSIQQAFRVAASVAYASDLEKKNSAELKTLLDYSFNGIIRLSASGEVVAMNHLAEVLFQKNASEIMGRPILDFFPSLSQSQLDQALIKGQDVFSAFLYLNDIALAVNLAPIKLEKRVEGAILSCHEIKKINKLEAEARRERYIHGHFSKYSFDWMEKNLNINAEFIKKAKCYSQSDAPLLITGVTSTEGEILAQSIHNYSFRKNGPYVSARCSAYSDEEQLIHLFGCGGSDGKSGVIAGAHNGTLFIDEVSELNSCAQYRLMKLILERILIRDNDDRPLPVNIRVITGTEKNLWSLVEEGNFRRDLFYAISTLSITFESIEEGKGDISHWAEQYIKEFTEKYSRYITLTKGAHEVLSKYTWDGGLTQLKSFCERLVISSNHRSVDEIMVTQLLNEAYPEVRKRKADDPIIIYKDPEAAYISELLEKYEGSRSRVADEMKISKTTLWRRMKKYGITGKYEL